MDMPFTLEIRTRNTDCSHSVSSAVNVSERRDRDASLSFLSPASDRGASFTCKNVRDVSGIRQSRAVRRELSTTSPRRVPAKSPGARITLHRPPPLPGHPEHRRTSPSERLGKQSRKYLACREDSSRREDQRVATQTTGWQTVGVPRRQAKANQTKAERERERERFARRESAKLIRS